MKSIRKQMMKPEDKGRKTDTELGHLTKGEIVVPSNIAMLPDVQEALAEAFAESGMDMQEFVVGSEKNKINPETGYPEFFSVKGAAGDQFAYEAQRRDYLIEQVQQEEQRRAAQLAAQRAQQQAVQQAQVQAQQAQVQEMKNQNQVMLRTMGEEQAGELRARRRSRRSLLSTARLDAEQGIPTLGTSSSL